MSLKLIDNQLLVLSMRYQGRRCQMVAISHIQCELSDSREDGADEEEVRVGVRPHIQPRHEHILGLAQAGGNSRLGQQGALTEPENIFQSRKHQEPLGFLSPWGNLLELALGKDFWQNQNSQVSQESNSTDVDKIWSAASNIFQEGKLRTKLFYVLGKSWQTYAGGGHARPGEGEWRQSDEGEGKAG